METMITTRPPETLRSAAELRFTTVSFSDLLDQVGANAPEVEQRKENLTQAATELLALYAVDDDFFAADDNAIGLLLAAHSMTKQSTSKVFRK